MSPAVGTRWFRDSGGIRPVSLVPLSGRYLSFAKREEIAILRVRGCGVREIARRTGRSPSTISRELRRNAATRGGRLEYRAMAAQWHADRRARRPKTAKLAADPALREYVQDRLGGAVSRPDGAAAAAPDVPWIGRRHGRRADRRWARSWSPEQICAEQDPCDRRVLYGAACHACLFAAETSCERGNHYLDRRLLVDTLAGVDAAFLPQ